MNLLDTDGRYLCSWRGKTVQFLEISNYLDSGRWLCGITASEVMSLLDSGRLQHAIIREWRSDGSIVDVKSHSLRRIKPLLYSCYSIVTGKYSRTRCKEVLLGKLVSDLVDGEELGLLPSKDAYNKFFESVWKYTEKEVGVIDFLAICQSKYFPITNDSAIRSLAPFDFPDRLPPLFSALPKTKSVVFLHNSYYHFNTLAEALKRRGWNAITVSVEDPKSPQRQFYFGEDINLFHDNVGLRHRRIREFIRTIPERYGVLHFYGKGCDSFFQEHFHTTDSVPKVPWDLLELRRHRLIIGYMASGCLDGVSQSAIRTISGNACSRCIWELRPDICSDRGNLAWAKKLESVCNWIGIEGDWAAERRLGSKYVHGPVVTALDPDYWKVDLEIPTDKLIDRKENEILIYHAVGNYRDRHDSDRNIKGSKAVTEAVRNLQRKGFPIKLFFASDLSIREVRYYKAQADIIVDQLNYGRLGANARESLMLGRPLVTRRLAQQESPIPPQRFVSEAPIVDATEGTIEDVLRSLVGEPERLKELAERSRAFALEWFSDDVCAHRFEKVVERISNGLPPESNDLYPTGAED